MTLRNFTNLTDWWLQKRALPKNFILVTELLLQKDTSPNWPQPQEHWSQTIQQNPAGSLSALGTLI